MIFQGGLCRRIDICHAQAVHTCDILDDIFQRRGIGDCNGRRPLAAHFVYLVISGDGQGLAVVVRFRLLCRKIAAGRVIICSVRQKHAALDKSYLAAVVKGGRWIIKSRGIRA